MTSPIVIGDARDPHVQAVADVVGARANPLLILDVSRLEASPYMLHRRRLRLGADEVDLTQISRGWLRRIAPPDWRSHYVAGTEDAAIRGAWLSLLASIVRLTTCDWLASLDSILAGENKLLQYEVANKLGINVPMAVVGSRLEDVAKELGTDFVLKPLGPAEFANNEGDARVVFTTHAVASNDLRRAFGVAPFIAQKRVEASAHLRVVTVLDRAWTCSLAAEGLPLDWRQSAGAHSAFREDRRYKAVEEDAVALATALGTGYSSQDWVIAEEGAVFLDLNPVGQWLFLPDATASVVTRAIGEWLGAAV